jgi:hypothetical protein
LRQSTYILNSQEGLNVGHDVGSFDLTPPGQYFRRLHQGGLFNIAHSI